MAFKLFTISLLYLAASSVTARSISVIGDVHIDISEDKFICDKIECPLNTERCVVSKEKDPKDPSILVRQNICYSETNEELKKSVTNETVNPNSQIKLLLEAHRSGGISTIQSSNIGNFDEEKFQKEFSEQMGEFHKNLNEGMENLNKELNQMSYDLAHMFD